MLGILLSVKGAWGIVDRPPKEEVSLYLQARSPLSVAKMPTCKRFRRIKTSSPSRIRVTAWNSASLNSFGASEMLKS